MLWKWLPWNFIVRRAARSYGVLDPASVLARMRNLAQPSEFDMPFEIIRHAILFHSRGVINSRAIQHNLDWIWPYWIERQYNPHDVAFLPRSAHFSHINLTHRNWVSVGLPNVPLYPIVDPRHLVSPLTDGWSIDVWVDLKGHAPGVLAASRCPSVQQRLDTSRQAVITCFEWPEATLLAETAMVPGESGPALVNHYHLESNRDARLILAARPYNPEGIQFIDILSTTGNGARWTVNREIVLDLDPAPESVHFSTYHEGDVHHRLDRADERTGVHCASGMATGAAVFDSSIHDASWRTILPPPTHEPVSAGPSRATWEAVRGTAPKLQIPEARARYVYETSLNSLVHLSASRPYPGPYTYHRFWYRDAALMVNALLHLGYTQRAAHHLENFLHGQKHNGHFCSQDGEWDSNGEVLWTFGQYASLTGESFPERWNGGLLKAVRWYDHKRIDRPNTPVHGLLPAGFSAEHFGPNDHYYWDNYWAVGGLRSVAAAWRQAGHPDWAAEAGRRADAFAEAIEASLRDYALDRGRGAIPASPYRRMDSGAIGVLVADYPLALHPPGYEPLRRSAEFFLTRCLVKGGFFQDMTHSGINIYLTLMLARSLLRAGDSRWVGLVRSVLGLASESGVWPEAVHPATGGGCIGDGQHGWAAAEWALWIRAAFVREEDDALVIGSGLLPEWLEPREPLFFGPTATPWGTVSVTIRPTEEGAWSTEVQGQWRGEAPEIRIAVPDAAELACARNES